MEDVDSSEAAHRRGHHLDDRCFPPDIDALCGSRAAGRTNRLRDLLRAYLLTGCRKSELLNLRVCDVKWRQDALILRAVTHKKRKEYTIPMLPELRALLEMRQHAPDGSLHPPEAFILGTAFGEHVPQQAYSLRKAWA